MFIIDFFLNSGFYYPAPQSSCVKVLNIFYSPKKGIEAWEFVGIYKKEYCKYKNFAELGGEEKPVRPWFLTEKWTVHSTVHMNKNWCKNIDIDTRL